jgi:YebC/PmpR family DNA-binding regulatory protein
MSGHSKWSTIKRKKGAKDAARGIVFTRVSKDITLAAREGGGDPDMNPSLRLAIKKAKAANMPASNIQKAVNKGIGNLPGVVYENFIYEGYGPGGVAIMMEVMTDNKKRTVPDIRHIMSKNGGNLGESGCVNWMFEKKGNVSRGIGDIDENSLLEIAMEMDIDDYDKQEDRYEISIDPGSFDSLIKHFEDKGYSVEGDISLEPTNVVKVSGSDASQLLKLLDLLESHEDIQKVYSNFDLDESELKDLVG